MPDRAPRSICVADLPRFARSLALAACAFALALALTAGSAVAPAQAKAAKPPAISATSYIIASLDAGRVLASRNRHTKLRPASTIKLLTALALTDYYTNKKKRIKISKATPRVEPTKVYLKAGYSYTADQLFNAMLIMSANDAARALTQGAGGTKKAMKRINAKARTIAMTRTAAKTPNGLDKAGQHVTARDMAVLSKHVVANKYLAKILKRKSYRFAGGVKLKKVHGTHVVVKRLASKRITTHTKIAGYTRGGLGLKNGWTRKARYTYVAAAKRNGKTYVVVILHAKKNPRKKAVAMLNWTFKHQSARAGGTL